MRDVSGSTEGERNWVVERGTKESTAAAVIRSIAAIKDIAETDLDPLYESVDIVALNTMIQHADDHGCSARVEFTFEGFTISVGIDDGIRIVDCPPGPDAEDVRRSRSGSR